MRLKKTLLSIVAALFLLPVMAIAQNPTGITVTDTMGTSNSAIKIGPVYDRGSVSTVITGTWIGTLVPKVSTDGITYAATQMYDVASNVIVSSTTANGTFVLMNTAAFPYAEIAYSAWTSGGAVITLNANIATQAPPPIVQVNAGVNLNTSALALEAGGNLQSIKTDVDKIPASPATETGHLAAIDANTAVHTVTGGTPTASSATWTTATALNTALTVTMTGYEGMFIEVKGGASLTAGAVTFENDDGSTAGWPAKLLSRTDIQTSESSYTLVSSTSQAWEGSTTATSFRVRLSTAITTSAGVGTTTVTVTPIAFPTVKNVTVGQSDGSKLNLTITGGSVVPNQASCTDKSSSVVTGGTSQTLASSNGSRKRLFIQNYLSATTQGIASAESLFISIGGTASTTTGATIFELGPGGVYDSDFGPVTTQTFTVTSATTGHRFYGCEQ